MSWFRRRRVRRTLALIGLYAPGSSAFEPQTTHGLSRRDETRP